MIVRTGLLGLAIGLALADSSIVTLALPEILGEFDVSITTVAWVLTSFNLVLALVAVPAAFVARRRPRPAFVVGTGIFAASSLACGLAPAFEVLVAARCVQAVGGGLVVTSALVLLAATVGSMSAAARLWVIAGVFGAALGPAAGGILTELLGWESIFLVQVPVALVPLAAAATMRVSPSQAPVRRPHLRANAALLFLSGGLVGALFLIVLLLVSGWGMSPAAAGVAVTAMPAAALVSGALAHRVRGQGVREITGVVLVAGGLAGLAFLPRAGWLWTIPPQLLVGAGLGLSLGALTERALSGRGDEIVQGGWSLASRHAGVVIGLLLLAPVLTDALKQNRDDAIRSGAAVVLDSRISALDKLGLARDILDEVDAAQERGELPRVEAVFDDEPDDEAHTELASELQQELDRAVTSAFSRPFLVATALALAALIPLALAVPDRRLRRATPVAVALIAAVAVVVPYAAFGGTSYEPTPTADPCRTREWRDPGGLQAVLEQVALSALDGAACDLLVTREELVLALRDEESLDDFAQEHGIERGEAERAIENGIDRAVDDAREAGSLSGFAATVVARAVDSVPPWLLLDALEGLRGLPL